MKVLVIDGMGGGIGRAIAEGLCGISGIDVIAVGTNSIATSAMIKVGAKAAATGENAVIYNAQKADYIVGVIGIIAANSMHGEISPKMAEAVSMSSAHKILIPTDKCAISIAGAGTKPLQAYIDAVIEEIKNASIQKN